MATVTSCWPTSSLPPRMTSSSAATAMDSCLPSDALVVRSPSPVRQNHRRFQKFKPKFKIPSERLTRSGLWSIKSSGYSRDPPKIIGTIMASSGLTPWLSGAKSLLNKPQRLLG